MAGSPLFFELILDEFGKVSKNIDNKIIYKKNNTDEIKMAHEA
jgi:hypothetical protein